MSKLGYPVHQQPSRVTFGTGSVRHLADGVLDERTVVFATGQLRIHAMIDASLGKRGARLTQALVLTKPAGEPSRDMVEMGGRFLRDRPFDRLVAIGGGSVLDWCRLSLAQARGALDLDSGRIHNPGIMETRPRLWLIPTTCATGAEAAGVAVFSDGPRKVPVLSPSFVADQVILDGQFLKGVDAEALAGFLGDVLTHAVEAFASIVPGTLAKEAAVSAARLVLLHAHEPESPSRHERLMEAGYLGGVAAANCSVGVVHAFSHSVAVYGMPHGTANAIALDAGIRANAGSPAIQALAGRLGFDSLDAFRRALAGVLGPALSSPAARRMRDALTSPEARAETLLRMGADVCMRTNPEPLSEAQLDAFLDHALLGIR